jgi:hypothetical protein
LKEGKEVKLTAWILLESCVVGSPLVAVKIEIVEGSRKNGWRRRKGLTV